MDRTFSALRSVQPLGPERVQAMASGRDLTIPLPARPEQGQVPHNSRILRGAFSRHRKPVRFRRWYAQVIGRRNGLFCRVSMLAYRHLLQSESIEREVVE